MSGTILRRATRNQAAVKVRNDSITQAIDELRKASAAAESPSLDERACDAAMRALVRAETRVIRCILGGRELTPGSTPITRVVGRRAFTVAPADCMLQVPALIESSLV